MFGRNKFNNVVINGKSINYNGSSIAISDGQVIIDGKVIQSDIGNNNRIIINGNVNHIECSGSVEVRGNSGSIDCGGSCNVGGDVSGNIDAGGSVTCWNVSGDIDAGGSVRCKTYGG